MENTICLDTDILADFLRNKEYAIKWIEEHEDENILATTIISIFELYYGAYKSSSPEKEVEAIEELIDKLQILDFSLNSVHEAGKQKARLEKEGKVIEFRDIFIGAITLVEGFSLKTNNKKHFERIEGLNLIDI